MKKIICLSISVLLVCLCFASCGNKISEEEYVTDLAGEAVAVITQEDGAEVRNPDGKVVVLVTDAQGKKAKGDDGEYLTEAVTIEKALILGKNIVMPHFSLIIPEGWEDASSYSSLQIRRDGGADFISITERPGKTTQEVEATNTKILDSTEDAFECERHSVSIDIGENDAGSLNSVFIPKDGDGGQTYLGYIVFAHGDDVVYDIMIKSTHDLTDNLGDFQTIIDSLKFVD